MTETLDLDDYGPREGGFAYLTGFIPFRVTVGADGALIKSLPLVPTPAPRMSPPHLFAYIKQADPKLYNDLVAASKERKCTLAQLSRHYDLFTCVRYRRFEEEFQVKRMEFKEKSKVWREEHPKEMNVYRMYQEYRSLLRREAFIRSGGSEAQLETCDSDTDYL